MLVCKRSNDKSPCDVFLSYQKLKEEITEMMLLNSLQTKILKSLIAKVNEPEELIINK